MLFHGPRRLKGAVVSLAIGIASLAALPAVAFAGTQYAWAPMGAGGYWYNPTPIGTYVPMDYNRMSASGYIVEVGYCQSIQCPTPQHMSNFIQIGVIGPAYALCYNFLNGKTITLSSAYCEWYD